MQLVQALKPDDYASLIALAQWYLGKYSTDPLFLAKVLFSDDAPFTREGIFNTHNAHMWAEENSHAIQCHVAQIRFSINVWAGIIEDHNIEPYLLSFRLTGRNYLFFLQ